MPVQACLVHDVSFTAQINQVKAKSAITFHHTRLSHSRAHGLAIVFTHQSVVLPDWWSNTRAMTTCHHAGKHRLLKLVTFFVTAP